MEWLAVFSVAAAAEGSKALVAAAAALPAAAITPADCRNCRRCGLSAGIGSSMLPLLADSMLVSSFMVGSGCAPGFAPDGWCFSVASASGYAAGCKNHQ
jgi:hypothetical protein